MTDHPVSGPLAGRTVVVTRPVEGASELAELLEAAGAATVVMPLIEIVDVATADEVAAAIDRLVDGDWVVVASAHAARRVVGPLARRSAEPDRAGLHVAAVGATTAAALGRTDLVAERQSADGLLAVFPAAPASTADGHTPRALVAQARDGAPTLTAGLSSRGWSVERIDTHVSMPVRPSAAQQLAVLRADAVAFTSGSQARAWAAAMGDAAPPVVVAIGPQTARDVEDSGLKVSSVATDHSLSGVVSAIIRAFAAS
jgi:uroporphyrinogen-III synthase